MKLYFRRSKIFALVLLLGACSHNVREEDFFIDPPESYKYYPISFQGNNIELLGKIDTVTPITLINHQSGEVSQTLTEKGRWRMDEYKGKYDYISLVAPPSWNSSDNYRAKIFSITAVVNVSPFDVNVLFPTPVSDKNYEAELDKKIKNESLLDSAIWSMGIFEWAAKEYIDRLKDKTPKLSEIQFQNRSVILVSYDYGESGFGIGTGPKFLKIGENIIPIKGSCTSDPYFYSVGEHLYFRSMESLCETGYVIIGNYAVLKDSIREDWKTTIYSN